MRSSKALLTLVGLSLFAVPACTPLRPKITKWHNELKVDQTTLDNHKEIDFGVHGFDLEPKSRGFNALQLSERGQKALISSLGALSGGDSKKLLAGLGTPIKPPAQAPGDVDATTIDRRLAISVTHLPLHPADRLQMLSVRLYPVQTGVTFTNWSQIATRYQTIDLGTLSFDQTQVTKVEASLAPSVISELTGVKASRDSTKGLKEATSLKSNVASLSGRLASQELFIFEKGGPGQDLTGVISVDTTIKLPRGKDNAGELVPPETITDFSGLFDKDGVANDPTTVLISNSLLDFPPWRDSVLACAELIAYTRRLCGGGSTITESDDCATMVPTTRLVPVTLSPPVESRLYQLQSRRHPFPLVTRRPLGFLNFREYAAAAEFVRYLLTNPTLRALPFDIDLHGANPSELDIVAHAPYKIFKSEIKSANCTEAINTFRQEYRSSGTEDVLNYNRNIVVAKPIEKKKSKGAQK